MAQINIKDESPFDIEKFKKETRISLSKPKEPSMKKVIGLTVASTLLSVLALAVSYWLGFQHGVKYENEVNERIVSQARSLQEQVANTESSR